MVNRRPVRFAVVLVLIAALAAAVFVLVRSSRKRTFTLSDGSTISLVAQTYGAHHVLKMRGPKLWQLLQPPMEIASTDTGTDVLALWIAHRYNRPHAAASAPVWPPVTTPTWWDWAEIADDTGSSVRTSNPTPTGSYALASNNAITSVTDIQNFDGEVLEIPDFPRRAAAMSIRFYRSGAAAPVAEFTVQNPKPGRYPKWTPESLPAAHSQDGVKFSLLDLRTAPIQIIMHGGRSYQSLPTKSMGHRVLPGETLTVHADFASTENGRPAANWKPVGAAFIDATGNASTPSNSSSYFQGAQQGLDFQATYCSKEPQRMRVEFAQDETTAFPPSNLWSIPPIALPSPGAFVMEREMVSKLEAKVHLVGLGSPGRTGWGRNPWESMSTPFYFVRIAYTPASSDAQVMMHADDESGHAVNRIPGDGGKGYWMKPSEWQFGMGSSVTISQGPGSESSTDSTGNEVFRTFFFVPRPGAHSLSLKFAIHKSEFVDFIVDLGGISAALKP